MLEKLKQVKATFLALLVLKNCTYSLALIKTRRLFHDIIKLNDKYKQQNYFLNLPSN